MTASPTPGCSQWICRTRCPSWASGPSWGGELDEWTSSRVQGRGGFFTPQLLNDFFNWFQQCCFSITDSIPATGQKNGLRKIIDRKRGKKKYSKTQQLPQSSDICPDILYWIRKKERNGNSSHLSACVGRRVRMYSLAFKPQFIHAHWPAPWFGTSCRKQLSSPVTLPALFLRQPSNPGADWRQFS